MDLLKKLVELVYYYEADSKEGKPYWEDPAVVALLVSLVATCLARYAGLDIDNDLQLKIVGSVTGIAALAFSKRTGIKAKPAPKEDDRNLTSLS